MQAENIIFGAILEDNKYISAVANLFPEHFSTPFHVKLFSTMLEMSKANEPIDFLTIGHRFKDVPRIDEKIEAMIEHGGNASNYAYFAKIIRDKAVARRLIAIAEKMSNRCYSENGDIEEIISAADGEIRKAVESICATDDVRHISEFIPGRLENMDRMHQNKKQIFGIPSGLTKLDEILGGFQKSDMIVIAAPTNQGKSSLALTVTAHIAVELKIPVLIFSLEMSCEQYTDRFIGILSEVDIQNIKTGYLKASDGPKTMRAAGKLYGAPIYYHMKSGMLMHEIRAISMRVTRDKNIGLIIIDYIQEIRMKGKQESREREMTMIAQDIKALAMDLNIPVISVSQTSRKADGRADKRFQLSDLRESGAIEQVADVVIGIYSEEEYDEGTTKKGISELIVRKQRNGSKGTALVQYSRSLTKFHNLAAEPEFVPTQSRSEDDEDDRDEKPKSQGARW